MQKSNFNLAAILFILFCFIISDVSAQIQEEIIKSFEKIYPHKTAAFDTLDYSRLETISDALIQDSYEISSLKRQIEKFRLHIDLQNTENVPYFFLSAGINNYDSYDRIVNVMANVPVEWDNKNPIKTDYRLPNGGRGIMWIPRPKRWEEHSMELHASTAYKDVLQTYSTGLNYKFPFGLSINALNLSINNRLQPKTYGYPYSAVLNNTFEFPFLKNFGSDGSLSEFERSSAQINMEIADQNIKNVTSDITYNLISQYLKTYISWNTLLIFSQLLDLTETQLKDYRILVEKNLLSVYDRLRIEREYARLQSQKETSIFDYVYSAIKLNPVKVINSQDVSLFIPKIDSLNKSADKLEEILLNNVLSGQEDELIKFNNDLIIADKFLQQSRLNLKYTKNQSLPDISLTGSLASFESDELGYNNIAKSLGNLFSKSDGITWNVGLMYKFSFASSPEKINYLASAKDYQDKLENLKETHEYVKQNIDDQVFKLKAARITLDNARKNLAYSKTVLKEGDELFSLQRISRFDHCEYKKNVLNEELNILSALDNYLNLLIQLSKSSGLNPKELINILEMSGEIE